eukprot:gene2308-8599_t
MKVYIDDLGITYADSQTEVITVTRDGNVGIGNASPKSRLTIQGGVDASDSFNNVTPTGSYQNVLNINSANLAFNGTTDNYYLVASINVVETDPVNNAVVLIEGIVGGDTTANSTVVSCKLASKGGLSTITWLHGAPGAAVAPVVDIQVWKNSKTGFFQVLVKLAAGSVAKFNLDVKAAGAGGKAFPLNASNIITPQGTMVKSLLSEAQLEQNWQGVATFKGDVDVAGTLIAQELVTNGPANIRGGAVVSNGLAVQSGDANVMNSINVYKTSNLKGGASVSNGMSVSGATNVAVLTATEQANFLKDVSIAQSATIQGGLSVSGACNIANGANVSSGCANVAGNSVFQNDMLVKGNATTQGMHVVNGSTTLGGPLVVDASSTMKDVKVTGPTSMQSVAVEGSSSFAGAATFANGINASGHVACNNDVNIKGGVFVSKNLTVTGASTFSGDTTTAGTTSTQALNGGTLLSSMSASLSTCQVLLVCTMSRLQ